MIVVWLMLLFALTLSGAAAYYSIAGLMAIFAGSPLAIAVMGSVLEGSKLVVASWLYRNWTDAPALMKTYLVTALLILMMLTSMGIFGFLSKAHLEHGVPTSDIAAKVELIDQKIATEKEAIAEARKALAQLDSQINRLTEMGSVTRGVTIREQQRRERQALLKQVETSQATIAQLNEQRAPIAADLRKVEAEVGPIKYVAALIYGDQASDTTTLEKAVRWMILLIVVVFDPLAVIMLIAANWSLARSRTEVLRADSAPEYSLAIATPTPMPEERPAPPAPPPPPPPAPLPQDPEVTISPPQQPPADGTAECPFTEEFWRSRPPTKRRPL